MGPLARVLALILVAFGFGSDGMAQGRASGPSAGLAPLPAPPAPTVGAQVELGKVLFFDGRLSGDGSTSCSNCHDPENGWADGLPLSTGYPGSLYFRNTPTVLNAVHGRDLYWDGRLPASDLPTVVRDHIAEAHFMQADGRLVIERLRQIPAYEAEFREVFGGEPTYGRILQAVSAFVQMLRSRDVPFDRYLRGQTGALSPAARGGLELFRGKAGCVACHGGPMLSDGQFHDLGLSTNADIFQTPERHITFRRFFKMFGVAEFARLREDVGRYAITKQPDDRGRFRTPTLREVSRTAPYMHDGSLETLDDVVDFYDQGGGRGTDSSALLAPLDLSAREKAKLVAFLDSLSGAPIDVGDVLLPDYDLRAFGVQE